MIEGDLKDHDIRLYLGMPMYGGMLGENTLHGVLAVSYTHLKLPTTPYV